MIKIVREISWHEVLDLSNEGENCTGIGNSGNFNRCNHSSGFFNSVSPPLYAFNKPLSISKHEFISCDGIRILRRNFKNTVWVSDIDMTDEEKFFHPDYKKNGGYLKFLDFKTAFCSTWNNLTPDEKQKVLEIPNFDAAVFKEITSIDVNAENS